MENIERIFESFQQSGIEYKKDEVLSGYTSFKIGGKCKAVVLPKTADEVLQAVRICKQYDEECMILGNGSNILVLDEGIDVFVIVLANNFSEIKLIDDCTVFATAGTSLRKLCKFCLDNGLTGMENLYGIPATVGGAIYMNAGAYGSEVKDVIYSATHIDNGDFVEKMAEDLEFSYRHSFYSDKNYTIVSGVFKLQKGDKEEIKAKMADVMQKRIDKQPLDYPSAGSTFKRPVGAFAGKLIEDCGLKGFSVGGAEVSTKHSGFVINKGGATSADVLSLIKHVQDDVKTKTGYILECEVKIPKKWK